MYAFIIEPAAISTFIIHMVRLLPEYHIFSHKNNLQFIKLYHISMVNIFFSMQDECQRRTRTIRSSLFVSTDITMYRLAFLLSKTKFCLHRIVEITIIKVFRTSGIEKQVILIGFHLERILWGKTIDSYSNVKHWNTCRH